MNTATGPLLPSSSEACDPPEYSNATTTTTTANEPPADQPPTYREESGPDPDEILPPATFALHGRFIYLATDSSSTTTTTTATTTTTSSDPLYQLSRVIHVTSRATESIDFQRLDYRVRTTTGNTGAQDSFSPKVSRRPHDVYQLKYTPGLAYTGLQPQFRLLPQSRKTVGEVSIERGSLPLFRSGWRALRVLGEGERKRLEREGKKVSKKGEYHFVIKEKGQGQEDGWEWVDPAGKVVASQQVLGSEGGEAAAAEVEYRLKVLVPLPRRVLDGLVAMWCLWLWRIHLDKTTERKTWEDRKRILHQRRQYVSKMGW
ncbi:uncharacterized protein B0T15DRAFT_430860 [Chaetomium strumarium]|uniref:Uncharacterized protein n=1 Tax=Chaetomium strumarium TaxID=1170767 RepID=A0AAJ0GUI2_9PEZI|nr:hypothetical protein B0T15DRAFT_430860 [Chaetomium strumarium]